MAGSGAAGGVGNRYVVLPHGRVNAASGIVIELVGLPEPLEGYCGPPRGMVTARA
ncbi:glycerate kinase [Bradyrhizobium sp. USDA 3240]|jgi:glycerate kinase